MADQLITETAEVHEVKSSQEGLRSLVDFLLKTGSGQLKQRLNEEGKREEIAASMIALEGYFFDKVSGAERGGQVESLSDLDTRPACVMPLLSGGGGIKLNLVKRPGKVMIGFMGHGYTSPGEIKKLDDLTSKLKMLSESLEQNGISCSRERNYLKYSLKP